MERQTTFQTREEVFLFTLEENHFNSNEPRKRPFHTIIPALITKDGKPYMSFGVIGEAMLPQGHAQIAMNCADFDMNLQEAGDAPRIRHANSSQPTGETMTDGGIVHLTVQSCNPPLSFNRCACFGWRSCRIWYRVNNTGHVRLFSKVVSC